MAVSSRLQGLHQVAKKLMMMGRPALERVSVLTFFPSKLRNITAGSCDLPEGCCANATKLVSRTRKVNRIFFIERAFWREMREWWVGLYSLLQRGFTWRGFIHKRSCKSIYAKCRFIINRRYWEHHVNNKLIAAFLAGRKDELSVLYLISRNYPTLPSRETARSFCASTANSIGSLLMTSLA